MSNPNPNLNNNHDADENIFGYVDGPVPRDALWNIHVVSDQMFFELMVFEHVFASLAQSFTLNGKGHVTSFVGLDGEVQRIARSYRRDIASKEAEVNALLQKVHHGRFELHTNVVKLIHAQVASRLVSHNVGVADKKKADEQQAKADKRAAIVMAQCENEADLKELQRRKRKRQLRVLACDNGGAQPSIDHDEEGDSSLARE